MICKILVNYGASEGWKEGDIVEITNPEKLVAEGKVEIYTKTEKVEPVGEITPEAVKTKRTRKTK